MKNHVFSLAVLIARDVFVAFAVWGIIGIAATSQSLEEGGGDSSGAVAGALQAPEEIFWHDNYAEAIAEAKATGKPLFLEFRCVP